MNDIELYNMYKELSKKDKHELLKKFKSNINGLSTNYVKKIFKKNGPNIVIKEEKRPGYSFFLESFNDRFIIILIILAAINFVLSDKIGTLIIMLIAFISALIRFCQDYSSYKFNEKLKAKIYISTNVKRDNMDKVINIKKNVTGDIILLNAGSVIPADVIILESKDLFINQSIFTGENIPVEKYNTINEESDSILFIDNICLRGSTVVSGSATCLAITTGFNTYLGKVSDEVSKKKEVTNFEIGMNAISKLMVRYMVIISATVFILNLLIKNNLLEALLFSISVAVGINPSMLPMIVNVNLTKGSKNLAKEKTLVKNMNAIQNLGAIDLLCTDKTGTLTLDKITLQKYINVNCEEDLEVLDYAYLNSFYSTGIKNLIDKAIISYGESHNINNITKDYKKIDEIPFDYDRKKESVVVQNNNDYKLITKGALEEIIKCCTKVKYKNNIMPITKDMIEKIYANAKNLAETGMQVIAVAEKKEYPGIKVFDSSYETEMILIGYIGFLDPPKKDVKETLKKLSEIGISTKILTGDNHYATISICEAVGLKYDNILIGTDVDKLSDKELQIKIEKINVFARLNPMQKERIVKLYRKNGHVVGYMGDGVNDAPSLKSADVGISVNTASDIAKETSDIILLEKSLDVIYKGVLEGRKIYGNIMKYMKMSLSANFGNSFSVLVASIFLPFLPMLPIQLLIQDSLYDLSQTTIPMDDVDKEFLEKPKKWDTKDLKRFMNIMGIVSSIIDVLAFLIFWFILKYNNVTDQTYFQTAWFIEGLISQTMIVHYVRTSKIPFIESHANKWLMLTTSLCISLAVILPILLYKINTFHFALLPGTYYIYIVALLILYSIMVETVKRFYIKKYNSWL